MTNKLFVSALIACLGLSACAGSGSGSGDGGTVGEKTESYSYEYEYNGCKTGKHQFSSGGELCTGLENNSLNNGCAIELRQEEFSRVCPGQTFTSFN